MSKDKELIIFDKDWTIVRPCHEGRFINSIEDQILLPGVAEKCQKLLAAGYILAVASNQGGVACEFMTYEQAEAIVAHAARLIGATLFRFCPHHPKGTHKFYAHKCDCRKPKPGMLISLMEAAGVEGCTYVGDMESDRLAALAAAKAGYEVRFEWAKDYFGEGE